MSIADKLTYLQTTKQLLKTEINKINNVLDDNSTFRSYPQELFNGYLDVLNNGTDTLWNNLEKVSASGEEATLENVETAPIKMVLNGNTSQETTTGKNLFTGLIKNVRLDPNNGEQFSGSTGASTDFIPVNINSNNSYYLSGLVDTIRSFTCAYNSNKEFLGRTAAQTVYEKALTVNSFTSGTPAGTGDIAYIRTTQYIQGEGTIDIIDDAKIQLEQGSTATSWEKYTGGQPSPSPDYPQQVKVVKGNNVVSVSGKNLLNDIEVRGGNGIVATLNNDGSISYNGIATATNSYLTNWITSNIPIGNYTFSINSPLIDYNARIQFTYEDSTTGSFNIPKPDTSLIIDLTKKVVQYRLVLQNIIVDTEYNGTLYFQLEQGTEATDYVPYTKTEYPINLGDIELCKIGNYKDYFHKDSGKWYVHKEIGKVVLDGSENWNNFKIESSGLGRAMVSSSNVYYNTGEATIIANNLKGVMYTSSWTLTYDCIASISNNRLIAYLRGATDLASFKAILSNSNATVYYALATPTEEEITNTTLIEQLEAISNAKSVKDKTYITQTNDELPFILDVEAIKEYEVN